uniref:Bm12862 n=1 Tax=Brugia malayi TaxID=6279 RepID=A0A1U7F2J8_BRUMA|nr:Bm12862 [Brugia malayi]
MGTECGRALVILSAPLRCLFRNLSGFDRSHKTAREIRHVRHDTSGE